MGCFKFCSYKCAQNDLNEAQNDLNEANNDLNEANNDLNELYKNLNKINESIEKFKTKHSQEEVPKDFLDKQKNVIIDILKNHIQENSEFQENTAIKKIKISVICFIVIVALLLSEIHFFQNIQIFLHNSKSLFYEWPITFDIDEKQDIDYKKLLILLYFLNSDDQDNIFQLFYTVYSLREKNNKILSIEEVKSECENYLKTNESKIETIAMNLLTNKSIKILDFSFENNEKKEGFAQFLDKYKLENPDIIEEEEDDDDGNIQNITSDKEEVNDKIKNITSNKEVVRSKITIPSILFLLLSLSCFDVYYSPVQQNAAVDWLM